MGITIGSEMGDAFGLMFDGWSAGLHHYLGVFALYHSNGGLEERLIGLSSMV